MTPEEFYDEVMRRRGRGQVLELMEFYWAHEDLVQQLPFDKYFLLSKYMGPVAQMADTLKTLGMTDQDLREACDEEDRQMRLRRERRL